MPTVELGALFTSDTEVPALALAAADLVLALELLVVLLDLLPHAASSSDAARVGTRNLVI
ncbi:MAG: hypothetical protein ACR2MK_10080 [Solirubrobacteraceae bacterium]